MGIFFAFGTLCVHYECTNLFGLLAAFPFFHSSRNNRTNSVTTSKYCGDAGFGIGVCMLTNTCGLITVFTEVKFPSVIALSHSHAHTQR